MSTKNLYSTEAKEKIKQLAEAIDYAMLATNLKAQPFHTVPMSTKEVDEDGNIWFLSNKTSTHNANIEREKRAHLIYSDKGNYEFLSVYGRATIGSDRNKIKELYGSGDDAWFEGVDDPNITTIKVEPDDAHYWDTKNGKVISLLKMAGGAITGNEPDLGVQGNLEI
ncbi:general stress protein [Aequorivita sp. H23M31]|uniref:General stress protein n=1 Tax=Aequorivita ciconiae TaxID=2494375 RepID=A0A410G016_9FLAO|nr:pyridoxamine 5'-phosphate oxidase family protein [Aequorivita sp. H23M31]QAA80607.1 general stress protein [Aequorivita sp. H23M31]